MDDLNIDNKNKNIYEYVETQSHEGIGLDATVQQRSFRESLGEEINKKQAN